MDEKQKSFNVESHARKMCNHISDCGGIVKFNNKDWNKFVHMVWDIWEDGYKQGQNKHSDKFMDYKKIE